MRHAEEAGSPVWQRNESLRHWEPPMRDRVRDHTSERVNQQIDRRTLATLQEHADASLVQIGRRLRELDGEWDIDRALMAAFAVLGGATAARAMLGIARRGRPDGFALLFAGQLGFLLYHAARGWCPPVAVLRRLGFRTAKEIEAERRALDEMLDERIAAAE